MGSALPARSGSRRGIASEEVKAPKCNASLPMLFTCHREQSDLLRNYRDRTR